jgi:hypothetical protein
VGGRPLNYALVPMWNSLVARWKAWQQKRLDSVRFERAWVLSIDDAGVVMTPPQGERQSIKWNAINRVAIETNDSGPWGADVWWLLEGSSGVVAYPQGATGDPEMLPEFHKRLPGFHDRAVIEAMGCTSNARFVCWERADVA